MVTIFGVKQGKKSWALARVTPFMILDKKLFSNHCSMHSLIIATFFGCFIVAKK